MATHCELCEGRIECTECMYCRQCDTREITDLKEVNFSLLVDVTKLKQALATLISAYPAIIDTIPAGKVIAPSIRDAKKVLEEFQ